jgi:hypothetical protein
VISGFMSPSTEKLLFSRRPFPPTWSLTWETGEKRKGSRSEERTSTSTVSDQSMLVALWSSYQRIQTSGIRGDDRRLLRLGGGHASTRLRPVARQPRLSSLSNDSECLTRRLEHIRVICVPFWTEYNLVKGSEVIY